ncbi:MerR family transcriptional regulator [Xylocopilactobacillus apis]|uniref:MerR family transcriptional regulator n=1 Tax=Xylocopilactobacillus apis TaxID=2932183 RepID=A0AAU9D9B6_9LACO|nr:MerR family transcriptional regulator [Xylocopilactobacillus apis]BDR57392.1 MerR family transcriptional regulator [Xylocopilactobacillus apis]
MFKIGDFSKLTNLTVRALHHYEKLGLLTPETTDPLTNYRYYSARQIITANQIKAFQQVGFSLKEIKKMLENPDLMEDYYSTLEMELKAEREKVKKKQAMLNLLQQNPLTAEYHIELKEIPERKVVSIRKIVASEDQEFQLWNELMSKIEKQNDKITDSPQAMTIYHDPEYRQTDVDLEVQMNVIGNSSDFKTISSFMMPTVTFSGSYEQMPQVTTALALWTENNGYSISGPMINIFHVSPAQSSNPDDWVTEAGYKVRPNK